MHREKTEKPLCIVNGSGTFNVPSGSGVSYTAGDPEPLPELNMPLEDHGRMVRLINRGQKVEMELELINRFTNDTEVHNLYAEIPGTKSPAPIPSSRTRSSSSARTTTPGTAAPARRTTPPAAS